jgi:MFS family permease
MYNRATSNRLLYTLFVTQSLFSASHIAVFVLMGIVAVRLSSDDRVGGLPSSFVTFSQALAAYPLSLIMGRFGRRFGLAIGYALGALGGLMGAIAITQGVFPLLLVSASLMGMARGSVDQSRFAAGEMFPENERARMIGRLVFAGTIGAVAGPALVTPSGLLMQSYGYDVVTGPFVAMSVLCALAALITFLLLRPDPMFIGQAVAADDKSKREADTRPARPLSALLMVSKVQLGIAAALISQTVMVVLMVMTPLYMHDHHHSSENISLVISMHTLGMYGLAAFTGYLIDRFGRIPMLFVGALILIGAALLAPLSTNEYILAVALFLLGLGWNFGYVSGSSLLADSLHGEERARVQGVNDSLVFFLAGFGSLASGPLFASGGYGAVSLAGLALTATLIGLIFWLGRMPVAEKAKAV